MFRQSRSIACTCSLTDETLFLGVATFANVICAVHLSLLYFRTSRSGTESLCLAMLRMFVCKSCQAGDASRTATTRLFLRGGNRQISLSSSQKPFLPSLPRLGRGPNDRADNDSAPATANPARASTDDTAECHSASSDDGSSHKVSPPKKNVMCKDCIERGLMVTAELPCGDACIVACRVDCRSKVS